MGVHRLGRIIAWGRRGLARVRQPRAWSAPTPVPILDRPRLIERVATSPPGAVVLMVAPAGSGKSTFLGQLRREIERCVLVELVDAHNDVMAFAAELSQALRASSATTRLDTAGDAPPFVEAVVDTLNQAAATLTVMFDNAHRVSDARVGQLISAIIRYSVNARFVISSRQTPPFGIAQMKTRRRVIEIDDRDLHLDIDQSIRLVRDIAPGVPAAAVRSIVTSWRGWPAALVIAGHTLRREGNPAEAAVGAIIAAIHEYVCAQVLSGLPEDLCQFVLELAVLGRFEADRLEAITSRIGAADLLAEVVDRRLFVEADPAVRGGLRVMEPFAAAARRAATRP